MRHLLNTIYLTQPDFYVFKEGETIVIEKQGQKILQLPIHNIEGIVVMNQLTITPALMEMCSENKIHISFISFTGKFLVKIQNPIHGNVRLRRKQYRVADSKADSLLLAKNFVTGKVYNCRCVLQRLLRDHSEKIETEKIDQVIRALNRTLRVIEKAPDLQKLLGIEGEAAKYYYSIFGSLITNPDTLFCFNGRSRRPPLDEINAMLSFFYTLLAHDVEAALETVGLDPQVGFYHQERPGRSSLALDIMEELRPYIVDRFVVTLINNRQVNINDFVKKENEAVLIEPEARKKLLNIWQQRKQETIIHPFLKEKIEIGLIPYVQALLMARYVREDLDGYPPFLMR